MATSSAETFNLSYNVNKFKKILDRIARVTSGKGDGTYLSQVVWETGEIVRDSIQISMYELVYSSPEKKYKRTQFLLHSVYLTTAGKTDRTQAFAKAYAAAVMFKGGSPSVYQTYRFSGHVPYNQKNAVRITAGAIYAASVEYGDGNNKSGPRPFMRNGALNAQKDVLQFVKVQYDAALNQIANDMEPRFTNTGVDYT